ncbi:hypothetical protein LDENG_00122680, partial [Lucifuga dentata]
PPSVTSLQVTNVTGTSFHVYWSSHSQTNQTYLISLTRGSKVIKHWETNQTMLMVMGLQPGVHYNVSVTPYACGREGNSLLMSVKTAAQTLDATARITNIQFTADLQNTSSQAYMNLTKSIKQEIYQSLSPELKALVDSGKVRIEITSLSSGSVVVNFTITFMPSESQDITNVSSALLHSLKNSSMYTVDENSTRLSDVDECTSGAHDCSQWATCVNTWGSYSCSCQERFVDTNPGRPGRDCQVMITTTTPETTITAPTTTTTATTTTTTAPTTTTTTPMTTTTTPMTTTTAPTTTTTTSMTTTTAPTTTTTTSMTTTAASMTTTTASMTTTTASMTTTTAPITTTTTTTIAHMTTSAPTTTSTTTTTATTTISTTPTTTTTPPTHTTTTTTTTTTPTTTTTNMTSTASAMRSITNASAASNRVAPGSISIDCRAAAITVTITRDFLLKNYIIDSALYLGLKECGVNGGNSTHVQLTVAWNECNTNLLQNKTYYTALVTLFNTMDPFTLPSGSVEVPRLQLQVPIMCTYRKNMLISANSGSMGYEIITDIITGLGSFQVTVQLMNGTIPLPHNYSLSPSDDVVVEVSLNTSVEQIKVVIDKCWATPTRDPTDSNSYIFLQSSCSLNKFTNVIVNGNSSTSRLSVRIFSFVNEVMIYLHCQVQICVQVGSSTCVPDCTERRTRVANMIGRAFGTTGPLLRSDDESLDDKLNMLQLVGFSCLGVGLTLLFLFGFICIFYYQRNRIGHYNFNVKPKQENFTYLVFHT